MPLVRDWRRPEEVVLIDSNVDVVTREQKAAERTQFRDIALREHQNLYPSQHHNPINNDCKNDCSYSCVGQVVVLTLLWMLAWWYIVCVKGDDEVCKSST